MGKKIIIGVMSLILVGALFVGVNVLKDDKKVKLDESVSSSLEYSGSIQEILNKTYGRAKSSEKFEYKDEELYSLVHWISNPVIKSKKNKRIGFLEPSPENIDKMIYILDKSQLGPHKFFIKSLNEWKKGNFVEVEEVHNTAWKMLDGNVGRAIDRDEYEINKLKEKYYK
ncbi:DUF6241 domain-containing protein [Paraclostridium bifermentans]|uniref:DUF6241 domain-containing protein n=1 Tax=Paraclostridium bifermentans TaxID=1490 RepID=UPI00290B0286|nr:DUF6241 domain-containing protein [Paraclostridium bifermentans]MDU3335310.1 DUF6241 domain-containing protein [Paraclostridium bifermentans]